MDPRSQKGAVRYCRVPLSPRGTTVSVPLGLCSPDRLRVQATTLRLRVVRSSLRPCPSRLRRCSQGLFSLCVLVSAAAPPLLRRLREHPPAPTARRQVPHLAPHPTLGPTLVAHEVPTRRPAMLPRVVYPCVVVSCYCLPLCATCPPCVVYLNSSYSQLRSPAKG